MTELTGIVPAPLPKHPDEGAAFPKWIKPDPSHVVTDASGNISVAGFDFHIDRVTKEVTVLVVDEEAEKVALAAKPDKE